MSQATALQQALNEYKAKTLRPSDALRIFYAENLLNISQQQSANACEQSLDKVAQLLQTLQAQTASKAVKPKSHLSLQQLNHYLNHSLPSQRKSQQTLSFREQLQVEPAEKNQGTGFADLQSKRAFLNMQQGLFAEQIVQDAIAQGPENPGPLNPQQLAINALKNMRDLSPAYLNRYVSFVDSLFALEQIDKQLKKDSKNSKA